MILIEKLNEVHLKIHCDEPAIHKEIEDKLSFTVNSYVPSKARFIWLKRRNMKEPLYDRSNHTLPVGLLPDLCHFISNSGYTYKIQGSFGAKPFSIVEAETFIRTLRLPSAIEVRDYQLEYFVKCVRNGRHVCICPTGGGKSLIAYLLFRYYNEKSLITVPTTSLVYQLFSDFKSYGYDADENIHTITAGDEKITDKILTITTWQSIQRQDKEFFKDFKLVIGDEVHSNSADSLQKIMHMMPDSPYRFGLTGTLPKDKLANMKVQGMFGQIIQFVSTDDLIKAGHLSPMVIKTITLNHNLDTEEIPDYEDEVQYLISSEKRNIFLTNLAVSLKGNTFLMFRSIAQGRKLFKEIQDKATCPVFYVDGSTPVTAREELRHTIENSTQSITVASVVFATGINISSINNIVLAYPSKSQVKILQSIGRGLRVKEGKLLTIFDISDILKSTLINTTYRHYIERLKIYKKEKFKIKTYFVDL